MANQKVLLFRTAKNLALRRNINPPNYKTATVQSLTNWITAMERPYLNQIRNYEITHPEFFQWIRRPALPFLEEIKLERRRKDYISYERGIGMREYFVNNFNHETSEISDIMYAISERLNHALRTGITLNADVNITFTLFNDGHITTKKFNSFLI